MWVQVPLPALIKFKEITNMAGINFMNHNDPTTPFDPNAVPIDKQYSKLTEEEKIVIFCKLKGMNHVPCSITQFIEDPYYLGGPDIYNNGSSIFQYWRDAMKKIYPSPVLTKYPFLVLSGAIGIGKSTVTKVLSLYTYHRIDCFPNFYKSIGLAPKPMSFVYFHKNVETAEKEFIKYFRDIMDKSPYFKNLYNRPNIKFMTSGPRGGGGIGTDLIFGALSEINFWDNAEVATERTNSMLIRIKSRYDSEVLSMVGHMILDSSAKGENGPTELFLNNTDPSKTWNCTPSHWEVKPQDYKESQGKTFRVYQGDAKLRPQILPNDIPIPDNMDSGRVIDVPIQLMGEFKSDMEKSLQDLAGKSTRSSNSFFNGNISHLVECSKLKNKIPETLIVDFYDKNDRIYDKIAPMINDIPKGTFLWLGLDLAVKTDTTGIAAVYFSHWDIKGKTKEPVYRCPFIFGLTRKEGQETSLFHVYDFLITLSKEFSIMVSADQAYSKSILQDLEREGIQTRYISTDRSDEYAVYLKNVINNERIELPEHLRLQREAFDLKVLPKTGKIDHPKIASNILDNKDGKLPGSKDIWDALISATNNCYLSVSSGEEYGYNGKVNLQLNALDSYTKSAEEESSDNFQNMIEGIF